MNNFTEPQTRCRILLLKTRWKSLDPRRSPDYLMEQFFLCATEPVVVDLGQLHRPSCRHRLNLPKIFFILILSIFFPLIFPILFFRWPTTAQKSEDDSEINKCQDEKKTNSNRDMVISQKYKYNIPSFRPTLIALFFVFLDSCNTCRTYDRDTGFVE